MYQRVKVCTDQPLVRCATHLNADLTQTLIWMDYRWKAIVRPQTGPIPFLLVLIDERRPWLVLSRTPHRFGIHIGAGTSNVQETIHNLM